MIGTIGRFAKNKTGHELLAGGVRMDKARIDIFLDEGWCLIDQLHRWSSKSPETADHGTELIILICDLQKLWSLADDLQLTHLSRTILAIEQIFERVCARSMSLCSERYSDVASGIEGLQELLLGFEATGEEPSSTNIEAIKRIEKWTKLATPEHRSLAMRDSIIASNVLESTNSNPSFSIVPLTSSAIDVAAIQTSVDHSHVLQLEEFTAKLEETCRCLHARILADEAPYVTTTSRLEYLAEKTRTLVEQILREVRSIGSAKVESETTPPTFNTAAEHSKIFEDDSPNPLSILHSEPLRLIDESPQIEHHPPSDDGSLSSISTAHEVIRDSHRILIVEDSLFYRQLFAIAVHSIGYEAIFAESVAQAVDMLQTTIDICAILVGSPMTPAMVDAIEHCRSTNRVKVIGLTIRDQDTLPIANLELDAQVPKMHPQQLIGALNQLLVDLPDPTRKIA